MNRNLMALFNGYTNYATDPPEKGDPIITKRNPPDNYIPSTPSQRANWNKFLDFLESKGVGGSKDLDRRDTTLGLKYLEEYNKLNPKQKVSSDFVPIAQYESYLIRKKGEFPGLAPQEAKYVFEGLSPVFKNREISDVDNWLGSYTSKQYYPVFSRGTSKNTAEGQNVTTGGFDFGTNFEDYVRSLKNASLQEKYRIRKSDEIISNNKKVPIAPKGTKKMTVKEIEEIIKNAKSEDINF